MSITNQDKKEPLANLSKERRGYLIANTLYKYSIVGYGLVSGMTGLLAIVLVGALFIPNSRKLPLIVTSLICGALSTACVRLCKHCVNSVRALPYVPPVAEQVAKLPADAVLVRGSDRPSATPEELLRVASESNSRAGEELLRAEHETKRIN